MEKRKGFLYFVLVLDILVVVISLYLIGKTILGVRAEGTPSSVKKISKREKASISLSNKEVKKSKRRKSFKKTEKNSEEFYSEYKELILDDFDSKKISNNLKENTGVFSGVGGVCERSFSADKYFPGGYSLKLNYNVFSEAAYAGFWSGIGGIDLTPYKYLSFWVKRSQGKESFKVELSDGISNIRISVRKFLSDKRGSSWQKVFIPLNPFFKGINNFKKMKGNFTIIFEYSEGPPYEGIVYIDEISFVTAK